MQHSKNLFYSVEIASYTFAENLAQFFIEYVYLKELQTCCKFGQSWESNRIQNLRTRKDIFSLFRISQSSLPAVPTRLWPWIVLTLLPSHDSAAADLWNAARARRISNCSCFSSATWGPFVQNGAPCFINADLKEAGMATGWFIWSHVLQPRI